MAAERGPLGMRDRLELKTRDWLELETPVAAEGGLQPEMRDRLGLKMSDRLELEKPGAANKASSQERVTSPTPARTEGTFAPLRPF